MCKGLENHVIQNLMKGLLPNSEEAGRREVSGPLSSQRNVPRALENTGYAFRERREHRQQGGRHGKC